MTINPDSSQRPNKITIKNFKNSKVIESSKYKNTTKFGPKSHVEKTLRKQTKEEEIKKKATPSDSISDFQGKLDLLEDTIRDVGGRILVAGDLNAKAIEWGMPRTDSRGKRILEFAARIGLMVMNEGNTPTFRRTGQQGTIPDITLASETLAPSMQQWKVIDDYTGSDHQYLSYKLGMNPQTRTNLYAKVGEPGGVDAIVEATSQLIHRACNKSMPRTRKSGKRRSVYWWSEEIADIRQECLKFRRKATRARRNRGNGVTTAIDEQYKLTKKKLAKTITRSKSQKWANLSREVNSDPWGLGYRIVTRKLGALSPNETMEIATAENIVNTLFPTHPTGRTKT